VCICFSYYSAPGDVDKAGGSGWISWRPTAIQMAIWRF
jgi:hypothetical protein